MASMGLRNARRKRKNRRKRNVEERRRIMKIPHNITSIIFTYWSPCKEIHKRKVIVNRFRELTRVCEISEMPPNNLAIAYYYIAGVQPEWYDLTYAHLQCAEFAATKACLKNAQRILKDAPSIYCPCRRSKTYGRGYCAQIESTTWSKISSL